MSNGNYLNTFLINKLPKAKHLQSINETLRLTNP